LKSGRKLEGQAPRRGGRLSGPRQEPKRRSGSPQLLMVLVIGCLVLGTVAGFGIALDRQLSGGLLAQRREAMTRPDWVALQTLPPYVAPAFTLVVDPGFHNEARNTRDERQTTIPRELVRQIHLLEEGIGSDARELMMAPVLEQRTSRAQLLELFLNRVELGNANGYPIYGLYYAAHEYLGKEPQELTLSEAATLAGLLLEPKIDRPTDQAGAVGVRRNEVLRNLFAAGEITSEQYSQAISERLAFQPGLMEMPMSRRIPTSQDTAVIRLPPQYLELLEEPDSVEAE
jgi:hypothetical protein